MRKLLLGFITCFSFVFSNVSSQAETRVIANCGASKGWSYFNYSELNPKEKSGWMENGNRNGSFSIVELDNGEHDILFKDATGSVYSARSEGTVVLLRKTVGDLAVLSITSIGVIEVYNLWIEKEGGFKFSYLANKPTGIIKGSSSLFVGNCSLINLLE